MTRDTVRWLVVAALLLGGASARPAGAYTGVTALWYDDFYDNYRLGGYTETYRDWWDVPSGYVWDWWCECYWYYEDTGVSVWAELYSPAGLESATGAGGWAYAGIGINSFRPETAGGWSFYGLHHYGKHWWQEQYDWWTEQWVWVYQGFEPYDWWTGVGVTVPCTVPSYEETNLGYWTEAYHTFRVRALGAAWSFAGRQVTEHEGPGAYDSCDLPGDDYEPQTQLTRMPWTLDGNSSYEDTVGWAVLPALYYRAERARRGLSMPCESSIPQVMHISCQGGERKYFEAGRNRAMIDVTDVENERAGARDRRRWP